MSFFGFGFGFDFWLQCEVCTVYVCIAIGQFLFLAVVVLSTLLTTRFYFILYI